MEKKTWINMLLSLGIIVLFCSSIFLPLTVANSHDEYVLPAPLSVEMTVEESMFRRMSVREFSNEPVTDEELSTVLWAACGYQSNGNRTISGINNTYSGIIYVLKEDAAYTYNPENHSLVFFKEGDWRTIVGWQYEAPIQLGLCYNITKADSRFGGAELGQIGQNIQLMANALNLGTVVCGQLPPAIEPLRIPQTEEGLIVMPLGHLKYPYTFRNRPFWISPFPRIQTSTMSLSAALDNRTDGTVFTGNITRDELSQFLWATYGFSPYVDRSGQEKNVVQRHRTVPSAHGYYPLRMYAVTKEGIYYYQPNFFMRFQKTPIDFLGLPILTFWTKKNTGDYRVSLANATSEASISSAPLLIVMVLDVDMTRPPNKDDLSSETNRRFWYFEAGASTHNVALEATSWGLSTKIIIPQDGAEIQSLLQLDETYLPLFVVPIGR
jgi:nitroreductase